MKGVAPPTLKCKMAWICFCCYILVDKTHRILVGVPTYDTGTSCSNLFSFVDSGGAIFKDATFSNVYVWQNVNTLTWSQTAYLIAEEHTKSSELFGGYAVWATRLWAPARSYILSVTKRYWFGFGQIQMDEPIYKQRKNVHWVRRHTCPAVIKKAA
jgi:hypothetical protein